LTCAERTHTMAAKRHSYAKGRRAGAAETSPMIETILKPEIHALIEAKDFAKLKATLGEMEVHDLSALLRSLEDEDLALVFRLVSTDQAAEALAELELEQQENLLTALSSEKVASIVNEMARTIAPNCWKNFPARSPSAC